MVFLLVPTVGMVQFVNVTRVIIALVRLQTKPLAYRDSTQPKQARFCASNAHLVHTPTLLAPLIVKSAMMILTNLNPMLQVVY
jgi:hypothetical protein